jgi:NADH pyrophosphatase NudC (nudix superfamily)
MNFCSNCGQPVELRIPPGDHLPRFVCAACGTVHYQNPRIVAGCVPVFEDRILMCRRAIEPRRGFWTFPAGFMENGETIQDAARRESVEEALAG